MYGVLSSSIRCDRGSGARSRRHGTGKLDPKMRALARLAAYVALDAAFVVHAQATQYLLRFIHVVSVSGSYQP